MTSQNKMEDVVWGRLYARALRWILQQIRLLYMNQCKCCYCEKRNEQKTNTLDDIAEDDGDSGVIETDVPGASLNGKKPCQLTIARLKCWLACRGAPLSRRKPEFIEWLAICVSKQRITLL